MPVALHCRMETPTRPSFHMFRFRPRLSLFNALLLMTVIGLSIGVAQLWREVRPLREELSRLRQELGYLAVEDENKIYAIQLPGPESNSFRYRIYLPKNRKFNIHLRILTVPGRPAGMLREDWLAKLPGSGMSTQIESGEHTLDVRVRRDPDVKDQWLLEEAILGRGTGRSGTLMPFLNDRRTWATSSEVPMGKQIEIDPNDGVVLLILRHSPVKDTPGGGWSRTSPDEKKDCPGVMCWIELEKASP